MRLEIISIVSRSIQPNWRLNSPLCLSGCRCFTQQQLMKTTPLLFQSRQEHLLLHSRSQKILYVVLTLHYQILPRLNHLYGFGF